MPEQRITSWRKSSRSGNNGNCVEVRLAGGVPQIRDSKLGEDSPILDLDQHTFRAFLDALQPDTTKDWNNA
jgi:hypothetical protein